jgi:hypothetical protein
MRRPSSILFVLALALALAAPGCQSTPREAATLLWPDMTDPYVQTTRRWTRSGAAYDGVNLAFSAAATLKSATGASLCRQVRRVVRPDRRRSRPDPGRPARRRAGAGNRSGLAAPAGGADKLSLRGERFKVFALSGENTLYPQEIRPMERTSGRRKSWRVLPYATPWRSFYTLRFQDVPPGPLALIIAGPAGRVELTWATFK